MNKETNTPVEFIFVPDEFGGAPYSLLPYEFPWTMTETRANQTGFGDVVVGRQVRHHALCQIRPRQSIFIVGVNQTHSPIVGSCANSALATMKTLPKPLSVWLVAFCWQDTNDHKRNGYYI